MERRFGQVSLFIVDEVSMVGARLLSKIDACMRWLFNQDQWLGGKHFAFMGDFLQLSCVRDTPLYSPIAVRQSREQSRGLLCWKELTDCVELMQQMRQAEQELYFDTMMAMRAGYMQEWHKLYLAGQALLPGEKLPPEFGHCTRIVATNEMRQALNREVIKQYAAAGADVCVYMADDVGINGAKLFPFSKAPTSSTGRKLSEIFAAISVFNERPGSGS